MNTTTATPAEIDQAIAEIAASFAPRFAKARTREDRKAAREALAAATAHLDAEYDRRGGWTRAFSVTDGHIHSSQHCGTCYPTTQYGWLPQVSGLTTAEIIDRAGERACTVCYPGAPVKPCTLWTAEETRTQAERDAETVRRAGLAAAKAAKAITATDGTPLRDEHGLVIATEVTAERTVVEIIACHEAFGYQPYTETVEAITAALAAKRGQTVAEVTATIRTKADRKVAGYLK